MSLKEEQFGSSSPETDAPRPKLGRSRNWFLQIGLAAWAFPLGLLGYRALGSSGDELPDEGILDGIASIGMRRGADLGSLNLLERNLYYVEQKYVEPQRLDPEAMFDGACDRVEREVPEALFLREPRGRRLQVSVGEFNTTLLIEPITDFKVLISELRRIGAILEEHLSPEVDRAEVEYAMINGALSTLDPHTILLPPVAAKEMEIDNQGEFGGLGIEISNQEGRLVVKSALEGTPAEKAGLKAGDEIIRIEDESTVNMDLQDSVSRLRGQIGTPVEILVKRKQVTAPMRFRIVRDRIKLNPVEGRLLEGNVGYVRIQSFNANVANDLDTYLQEFHQKSPKGIKGLVLDLRGNPGGFLTQAVEVSDRFLADGVIVATVEGSSGRREEQRAQQPKTEADYPIVVLVNANSASASEIVAGALRNLNRAVIVGERTFGKGSVQHLYSNKDDSSLKLTVARYLTPGDHSIQSIGIPPDIQLAPSVVRPSSDPKVDPNPLISLYWREWADREAELDRHLSNSVEATGASAYSLRYVRPPEADDDGAKDHTKDWELNFARQLVLAAPSGKRAEILAAAGPLVDRYTKTEMQSLQAAFSGLGLDWTAGENPNDAQLELSLDLGEDGVLKAGVAEDIKLRLTNKGNAPVYQVSARTRSGNPWLDEREFYFGRLLPGESRIASQHVLLHEGYGDEAAEFNVDVRDPSGRILASHQSLVVAQGVPLPAFSWTVRLVDDGTGNSRGNGDGKPQVGELIELEFEVKNIGQGAAEDAWVRVKNQSSKRLDLKKGSLPLGVPLTETGAPCDPAVVDDCVFRFEPNTVVEGRVSMELRSSEGDPWELLVKVGDNQRYDHASVSRSGFYEYFQMEETLSLVPGEQLANEVRQAPQIQVERKPVLQQASNQAVLSGLVTDDRGLRDVMVYLDDQKVFYRGGDRGGGIPFSVEATLKEGANRLVVLARDQTGLLSSRSVSVYVAPAPPPVATSSN